MPLELSGDRIVRLEKTAHSGVSAGSSNDHGAIDHQRSTGRAVVLFLVCILNVPDQAAGAGIKAQEMSIVGFGIDKLLPHRDATIFVRGSIIQQPRAYRPLVVPQGASGFRVE